LIIGVDVAVGVEVRVGVGVLVGQMPPGHGVQVGVGVFVGPEETTNCPPNAPAGMSLPSSSLREAKRSRNVVPSLTLAHVIVARTPSPLGPGGVVPPVTQPNRNCFIGGEMSICTGLGQNTVRPLLPRNVPFVAFTNETIVLSKLMITSYEPRLLTFRTATSTEACPPMKITCDGGIISSYGPAGGVAVGDGVSVSVAVGVAVAVGGATSTTGSSMLCVNCRGADRRIDAKPLTSALSSFAPPGLIRIVSPT